MSVLYFFHKSIRIFMEVIMLGANTLYRVFCFFKTLLPKQVYFGMVGKGIRENWYNMPTSFLAFTHISSICLGWVPWRRSQGKRWTAGKRVSGWVQWWAAGRSEVGEAEGPDQVSISNCVCMQLHTQHICLCIHIRGWWKLVRCKRSLTPIFNSQGWACGLSVRYYFFIV